MRCFAPPPMLRPYVNCFWTLASDGPSTDCVNFITFADGLPGLIFQQLYGGHARQVSGDLPTLYLYGQSVQPNRITLPAFFRAIWLCRPVPLHPQLQGIYRCVPDEILPDICRKTAQFPATDPMIAALAVLFNFSLSPVFTFGKNLIEHDSNNWSEPPVRRRYPSQILPPC